MSGPTREQVIERLRAELALCKPHPDCDQGCMLSCKMEADYAKNLEAECHALRAALQHEKDVAEAYKAEADALRERLDVNP